MKALGQEEFEMIKVVNLCNHCDVNRELCNTHLLFCDGFVFFLKGGIEYKQYSFGEKCYQTQSTHHIFEHENPSFKILFLT